MSSSAGSYTYSDSDGYSESEADKEKSSTSGAAKGAAIILGEASDIHKTLSDLLAQRGCSSILRLPSCSISSIFVSVTLGEEGGGGGRRKTRNRSNVEDDGDWRHVHARHTGTEGP
eukprot:7455281-Pyramimonas_sp.AAC.1